MDARIAELRSLPKAAQGATSPPSIVVIGLGYVGLPLAVSLARSFPTLGLDIDASRIAELTRGEDRTGEIDASRMAESALRYATDAGGCEPADVYIVTVPTPVDERNRPDLRALLGASEMVGKMLDGRRKPLIIFESTVYPGVTEELCVPVMERASGLTWKDDFVVGYSPERINPGDREHTVDRIVKVVAGDSAETTDRVAAIYEQVTTGGTFRAASIKAAEGAKAIENAQRGHCIGVDPYYLSHRAIELGHLPEVIPAARSVNDDMARWIADTLHLRMARRSLRILILGVTFKEDVPDLRNSKVGDIVKRFWFHGHSVTVHDPLADAAEAERDYGVHLDAEALDRRYDLVVSAVSHAFYREMDDATLAGLVEDDGLFADVKGVFRGRDFGRAIWTL